MSAIAERARRLRSSEGEGSGGRLPTRSRSYGVITGGVLVVAVGALLGALFYSQSSDTVSVLAVRDSVAAGQTIERDNLISTQVSGIEGAVPVESADSVIGQTATLGLVDGQVITDAAVTDSPLPGAGEAVVGLALTSAQLPGEGLAAGDLVQVVSVPAADEAVGTEAPVLVNRAQVVSVIRTETGEASTIVTILAPEAQGAALATASATGRAAVIKVSTVGAGQQEQTEAPDAADDDESGGQ